MWNDINLRVDSKTGFLHLNTEHVRRMADFFKLLGSEIFLGVWSDNCHGWCQLFIWLCPVGKANFQHACSWCTTRKSASQAEKSKLYENLLLAEVRRGGFCVKSCQSQLQKVALSAQNDRVKLILSQVCYKPSKSPTWSLRKDLYEYLSRYIKKKRKNQTPKT